MNTTDTDVLVIGAGPAGACAASLLHAQGLRVCVAEKETFPRFVIGESLLPHCMDLLEEAGLLEAVQARGFMRKGGAVFKRNGQSCDFDFAEQFTSGWTYTYQVPRAEFDQCLADAVASRGVPFLYRHAVQAVRFPAGGVEVDLRTPDGDNRTVTARFLLDASGYGRVLPRLLGLERPSSFPVREAMFAHVSGDRRPPGRGEGKIWACIHPEGAWLWVIPFSNGTTSVGVVAEPEFFQRYPEDPEAGLKAIVQSDSSAGPRLEGMTCLFPPRRLSGFACAVSQLYGERYALVGNATEFLDPIFSSGVTLALHSASRAAKVLGRELRGETVDWQRDYADPLMQGINTFRTYVAAWYDGTLRDIIFAAPNNPQVMRQICSVLAGYVWDTANPYAIQAERALPLLARIVSAQQRAAVAHP